MFASFEEFVLDKPNKSVTGICHVNVNVLATCVLWLYLLCFAFSFFFFALRQFAHQKNIHLQLGHFTDVRITDPNNQLSEVNLTWSVFFNYASTCPTFLFPFTLTFVVCSFIWPLLFFFFWDCSFSKHNERSEIGKQAEGGAEHLENLKGLVSIWTVFDDAQGNIQIFCLYICCTVCLPSPIIAAFLRLKLETRQNIVLYTQAHLKLRNEHTGLGFFHLLIYILILISDQLMYFFVAPHIMWQSSFLISCLGCSHPQMWVILEKSTC